LNRPVIIIGESDYQWYLINLFLNNLQIIMGIYIRNKIFVKHGENTYKKQLNKATLPLRGRAIL
jgi:hypothetical protein